MPFLVVLRVKDLRFKLQLTELRLSSLQEAIASKPDVQSFVGPEPVFEVFDKDLDIMVTVVCDTELKDKGEVFLVKSETGNSSSDKSEIELLKLKIEKLESENLQKENLRLKEENQQLKSENSQIKSEKEAPQLKYQNISVPSLCKPNSPVRSIDFGFEAGPSTSQPRVSLFNSGTESNSPSSNSNYESLQQRSEDVEYLAERLSLTSSKTLEEVNQMGEMSRHLSDPLEDLKQREIFYEIQGYVEEQNLFEARNTEVKSITTGLDLQNAVVEEIMTDYDHQQPDNSRKENSLQIQNYGRMEGQFNTGPLYNPVYHHHASDTLEKEALLKQQAKEAFDLLGSLLRKNYKADLTTQKPLSWIPGFSIDSKTFYVELDFEGLDADGTSREQKSVELNVLYGEISKVNGVLIMGDGGMGKTTLTHKMAFDWATSEVESLLNFGVVLLFPLRQLNQPSILNEGSELSPLSSEKGISFVKYLLGYFHCYLSAFPLSTVQRMFQMHGSEILVVLDGLDEVSETRKKEVAEAIRSSVFASSKVVVTSRPTTEHLGLFQSIFKIKGLTREKGERLVKNYFKLESIGHYTNYEAGKPLRNIAFFLEPESLFEQTMSAFLLFLVCFSCEESSIPLTSTFQIFANVFSVLGKKSNERLNLYLTESQMEEAFLKLGKFAYLSEGIQAEYKLEELEKVLGKDAEFVLGSGIMSKLNSSQTIRSRISFQFSHKFLFEYLRLMFMSHKCKDGISSDRIFLAKIKTVCSVYENLSFPSYSIILLTEKNSGCVVLTWKKGEGKLDSETLEVMAYMGIEDIHYNNRIFEGEETGRLIKYFPTDLKSFYTNSYFPFVESQLKTMNTIRSENDVFYFSIINPHQNLKREYVFIRYGKIDWSLERNEPFVSRESLSLSSSIPSIQDHFASFLSSPKSYDSKTNEGQLELDHLIMPILNPVYDFVILRYLLVNIFHWPFIEFSENPNADSEEPCGLVSWVIKSCLKEGKKWQIDFYEYEESKGHNKADNIFSIYMTREGIELRQKNYRNQSIKINREETFLLDDLICFVNFPKLKEKFVMVFFRVI